MARRPTLAGVRRAAIILAGGRGTRLGEVRKVELPVGGAALLQRVLDACTDWPTVVVGPTGLRLPAHVSLVTDEPAHLGPMSGLRTGVAAIPGDVELVALLAGDQPFVTRAALEALAAAAEHGEAAAYVRDGHVQFLCAVWRGPALRAHLAGAGASMRSLYAAADVVAVPDPAGYSRDVDTPADLAAARRSVGDPLETGVDIAPVRARERDERQPEGTGGLDRE